MLITSKSLSISGQSSISGQQVMNFSATIDQSNGRSNITQAVLNKDLYDSNKTEVRKDAADFTDLVYDQEDKMAEADKADTAS
ncbi:hypothetical protein [Lapidilactobacillus gannanensis]|uniref:Uncharacterized protein n=1 Tax=Lapidilactobacillus gannanensis TaxID=2486002 RepID=A0ABW4BPI0_9LACO|nr:hypothetical protein [Lapidilactobacillus gannanensis]